MKEFEVTVTLPADPQTALRVLYSDAAFFSAYHERVGDAVKSVSDWDAATKTRTVCFMKRLDIPAPIARVLGDITSLNVQDVQVFATAGDAGGAGATVTSTPNVGVKALEKFKTRLTNTLERGAAENQCVLRTKVTVDAPLFGLQTLIERQMASVAAESLEAFNAHAVEVLSARAKEAGKAPPLPRHPLEPASPLRSPRLTRSGSAAAAAAAGLSPRAAAAPAASPLARNQSLGKRRRGGDDEAAPEDAPEGAEPAAEAEAGAALARASSLRRRVSGPPPAPARKC